ncbi:MAG TPA: hypothetical protein EYP85_00595 [Armatimonadetes bacterium]|nr:hypothetical protein [Armatimonadota bacterium]
MKVRWLVTLVSWFLALAVWGIGVTSCAKIAALLEGATTEEEEEAQKEAEDLAKQLEELRKEDPTARQAALNALREMKKLESLPAITRHMEDEDEDVVIAAIRTLCAFAYVPEKEPEEREIDPEAYQEALELKRKTTEVALDSVLRALTHPSPDVRYWAVTTLQHMGLPPGDEEQRERVRRRATEPLCARLRDENRDVGTIVADTLVALRIAAAGPDLIAALKDPEPQVRQQAAFGLGELQVREAVEALIQALRDEDAGVRWRAARSLAILADPKAEEALLAALEDENLAVRQYAIHGLSRLPGEKAQATLARLNREEFQLAEQAIAEEEAKRRKKL